MSSPPLLRVNADEIRALAEQFGLTFKPDVIVEKAAEAINIELSGYVFDSDQALPNKQSLVARNEAVSRLQKWADAGLELLDGIEAGNDIGLSLSLKVEEFDCRLRELLRKVSTRADDDQNTGHNIKPRQTFIRLLCELFIKMHQDACLSVSTRETGERYGQALDWCKAIIALGARPVSPAEQPEAALAGLAQWAARRETLSGVIRQLMAEQDTPHVKIIIPRRWKTITDKEPIRRLSG